MSSTEDPANPLRAKQAAAAARIRPRVSAWASLRALRRGFSDSVNSAPCAAKSALPRNIQPDIQIHICIGNQSCTKSEAGPDYEGVGGWHGRFGTGVRRALGAGRRPGVVPGKAFPGAGDARGIQTGGPAT